MDTHGVARPAPVGLEPRFSDCRIDMIETVRKRRGTSLYLAKDTFDRVSGAMLLDTVAVVSFVEGTGESSVSSTRNMTSETSYFSVRNSRLIGLCRLEISRLTGSCLGNSQ